MANIANNTAIIPSFHLRYAKGTRQIQKNVKYPDQLEIASQSDLMQVVQWDHIGPLMKGSHRKEVNYLEADVLLMDLDNSHSEDPDTWKTLDDIQDAFPDVCFYYVKSRNYMKVKTKEDDAGNVIQLAPREKYHLYFPLRHSIDDREACSNLMLFVACVFPEFDLSAAKPEQFFFGVESPEGGLIDGDITIDEFINETSEEELKSAATDFINKVVSGEYDQTKEVKKAVKKLCTLLDIKNPFPDKAPKKEEPKKGFVEALGEDLDWLKHYDQDERLNWFTKWAKAHNVDHGEPRRANVVNHTDCLIIPVKCPDSDSHTTESGPTSSVVIIDLDGTLNFICKHDHCHIDGWKAFRSAYDPEYKKQLEEKEKQEEQTAVLVSKEKALANVARNERGEIKKNRFNYDIALTGDGYFMDKTGKSIFFYNLLDGLLYVSGAAWNTTPHPISPIDESEIMLVLSHRYGLEKTEKMFEALRSVAYKNKVHPVREIIDKIRGTWDGVERLKDLFPRYLGAERNEYTTEVTKVLFHGIIQRVYNPGCKFDLCIVLKSPKGSGKSTLVKAIALDDRFFTDDLKDMGSEKVFEKIRGKTVVELGEMVFTMKTKEIESIKSFLSRTADNYREPYTRAAVDYRRQCVFIGTTNRDDFMPNDITGNRRFVPVFCTGKAERHPLDDISETKEYVRQCYAEALFLGERDGYSLDLSPQSKQVVEDLSDLSMPEDYRIGMVQRWLDALKPGDIVCTKYIYDSIYCDTITPSRYELRDLADIMNNKITGWAKYPTKSQQYRFTRYGPQKAWIKLSTSPEKLVDKSGGLVDKSGCLVDKNADDFLQEGVEATISPFTLSTK